VNADKELSVRIALAIALFGLAMAWPAPIARAQEPPSITITAPVDGALVPGPDITVEVTVSGFALRPPLQETREPNAGHIEYFLDVPPAFDQPTPLGEDNILHSGRFSETFAAVSPGEHTVYVCLAYDDHTCIGPSLTDSARVTLGQASPTPEPTPEPTSTPEATREPTSTPQATPEPPPTATPPPPTPPPPTQQPILDGMTAETPSPTATATASPTPPPTPRPLGPTSTPAAGLAPPTHDEGGNARSLDWVLTLACISVVGIVALGWLTLMGVRWPRDKR
jgi:hypothetical protein